MEEYSRDVQLLEVLSVGDTGKIASESLRFYTDNTRSTQLVKQHLDDDQIFRKLFVFLEPILFIQNTATRHEF